MSNPTQALAPVAALCAVLGTATAVAADQPVAELAALKGTVLVEQGDGYVTVDAGTPLHASARLFVLEESHATLTFADGCREEIQGPSLRTLMAEDTCRTPAATDLETAAADAAASPDAMQLTQAATAQGVDQAGLIGLGVAAAAGFTWAATNDDADRSPRPISPQ